MTIAVHHQCRPASKRSVSAWPTYIRSPKAPQGSFASPDTDLVIAYVNKKITYVERLAEDLGAPILIPLDVSMPGMLEIVF